MSINPITTSTAPTRSRIARCALLSNCPPRSLAVDRLSISFYIRSFTVVTAGRKLPQRHETGFLGTDDIDAAIRGINRIMSSWRYITSAAVHLGRFLGEQRALDRVETVPRLESLLVSTEQSGLIINSVQY